MANIPNIPNARYIFDFRVMPSLVFHRGAPGLIMALDRSKGAVLADIMNNFYKDFAAEQSFPLGDEPIFSPQDFFAAASHLCGDSYLAIVQMPDDDCEGIIVYYHLIVFELDTPQNVRLFTVERSVLPKELTDLLGVPSADESDDEEDPLRVPPSVLCEILRDGGRANYGEAPRTVPEVLEKLKSIVSGK